MSRIAANPIPYWPKAGKTREVFEEAFRDFQSIGFTAVKADVPEGMTPAEYADWIGGYGLAPALSLFSSPFDETVDMAAEVERPSGSPTSRSRSAWTARWCPRWPFRPDWRSLRWARTTTNHAFARPSTTADGYAR